MNTTTTIKTTLNSSNRIMLFVVLFVLCSVNMFSQKTNPENITLLNNSEISIVSSDEVVASTQTSSSSSTINIVSWFMGTKQMPSNNQSDDSLSAKKQMINSGIAPNRLLIKAFLKKASNYNSTLA